MTDEEADARDPGSNPAEIEAVRRLLGEARATGPMPADVANRMDDLIASLAAESPPAPVVDLAARRRRRVGASLVAAAAVAVLGFSVPRVLPDRGDPAATDAADSASAPAESDDRLAESDRGADAGGGRAAEPEQAPRTGMLREAPPEPALAPVIRVDHFRVDAAEIAGSLGAPAASVGEKSAPPCDIGVPAADRQAVAVSYDGKDAVLLVTERADGRRRAELYFCDQPAPADGADRVRPARSALLP
ncbi:MAG: hypothetical protein ACRCYQ_02555 [Nocardioides sp.]